ncbi:MAG: type II toxin-antitoxin system MqsA family antitoxin [Proteobacteria bacterium]|nr:type II toxin-antitoxin system MqsA family antitoxin [Pseudomonadota bacterium]
MTDYIESGDSEDFDALVAGLNRALIARRITKLRERLGMTQADFAEVFGIPVRSLRRYEAGHFMPPSVVCAYISVIEAEPDVVRRALGA